MSVWSHPAWSVMPSFGLMPWWSCITMVILLYCSIKFCTSSCCFTCPAQGYIWVAQNIRQKSEGLCQKYVMPKVHLLHCFVDCSCTWICRLHTSLYGLMILVLFISFNFGILFFFLYPICSKVFDVSPFFWMSVADHDCALYQVCIC